jgi:hypothetical protein
MTRGRRLSEAGVALPLTVFLVAVLTVMLAASFTRIRSELQLADGSNDMVTAFGVAQSGLNSYLGLTRDSRPLDGDSARINVVGGYADVVASLIRNDTLSGRWTYVVRSTGRVIDPAVGAEPQGVHTVAQFAEWQWGNIAAPAAWTSIPNIVRAPGLPPGVDPDVVASGTDACGLAATIPGIRARAISDTTGFVVSGSPPIVTDGSSATVSALTGISWNAILNGAIGSDHDSLIPGDTTYATYHIDGDVTATNLRGSGLLTVSGQLTTTGNYFAWDGIVLVGNSVWQQATDSTVVRGLLVTGLNWQTGHPYVSGIVDDPPIAVYYDSCKVRHALQSVRGFLLMENAWFDLWATY